MGLTADFLDSHVVLWEKKMSASPRAYRKRWPSRLFHHASIENATQILKSGVLLSRHDSASVRLRDVAGLGVIDRSERAHRFARLYFRPNNPTQFSIAGIRKPGECPFGESAHAPVLVMFVFDSRKILSRDGTHFSDRNMQTGITEGYTREYFDRIPFEQVYHDGPISGDRDFIASVTKHRCAEVLAQSPLDLAQSLQWVFCRSTEERALLLQYLENFAEKWQPKIQVARKPALFENNYTFVDTLFLTNTGLVFRLNPRKDGQLVRIDLRAWNADGRLVMRLESDTFAPRPPNGGAWRVSASLVPGSYTVIVELEGHLAYRATHKLDDLPF